MHTATIPNIVVMTTPIAPNTIPRTLKDIGCNVGFVDELLKLYGLVDELLKLYGLVEVNCCV